MLAAPPILPPVAAQPARLTLAPRRFLSTDYQVHWNEQPLTLVTDTYGPLAASFRLDQALYQVGLLHGATAGRGLLRHLLSRMLRDLRGRGGYALRDEEGRVLASARRRGFLLPGFDLQIGSLPAQLLAAESAYQFTLGADGQRLANLGRVQGQPRAVWVEFEHEIPRPVAIFVALLGLSHWETISTGSG